MFSGGPGCGSVAWLLGATAMLFVSPPDRCLGQTVPSLFRQQDAATRSETAAAVPPTPVSPTDAQASMQWLASWMIRKLPRTWDGDHDWGRVKRVWSGVNVDSKGLRLKTNRRFREVNHGHWVRYTLFLPEDSQGLTLDLTSAEHLTATATSPDDPQGWRIDGTLVAPLQFSVRLERWNYGIKWYSLHVTGHMRVRMRSTATIDLVADYTVVPPAMVLVPHVESAELELQSFEVERISKVGGDVAEAWGEVIKEVIRDRLRRKENVGLADKLNRGLERHRDELRLSLFDATSRWLSDPLAK